MSLVTKCVEFGNSLATITDIGATKQKILYKKNKKIAKQYGIDTSQFDVYIKSGAKSPESKETTLKIINNILKVKLGSARILKYVSDNSGFIEKWLISDNKCTDGKDDGKISFWSKVGNCLEGAAKTIVGTVYNIVTDPKKLVLTVAGGLALALFATTPVGAVVVPILGVAGGAKLLTAGIKNILEADQKAKNASTDEEAKDAWEDIGQGGTQVAAGTYLVCSSTSSILKTSTDAGLKDVIKENAEVFASAEGVAGEAVKSILDPGNIEAA